LLGKVPKPSLDTATPMLERVKRLPNLMVLNDEAHHVHDDDLAWSQTLLALHDNLKRKGAEGLAAWLDFTATPKNQNGTFFPWIVVDYPLAQAVEDRIVKTPLIIHQTDKNDPDKYARIRGRATSTTSGSPSPSSAGASTSRTTGPSARSRCCSSWPSPPRTRTPSPSACGASRNSRARTASW
jgi:hypothetical protein